MKVKENGYAISLKSIMEENMKFELFECDKCERKQKKYIYFVYGDKSLHIN